jgi:excisionase family DNA binding protein
MSIAHAQKFPQGPLPERLAYDRALCKGRDMTEPVLIGSGEAGEILGIDRATVTRWVKSGRLRSQKLPGESGAYVFDRAAVEQLRDEIAAKAASCHRTTPTTW